jgi:hypothetical protein
MKINSRLNAPERFVEAVMNRLTSEPKLLNDLISDLRFAGWRNVREQDLSDIVQFLGGYERWRQHGAGNAVYVATAPFETVDYRGKQVPVRR